MILWLFEVGYLLQHVATIMQIMTIYRRKSIELVSIDTNYMFLLGAIFRLAWMHDSMLGDFPLAYIEVVLALFTLGFIIYVYHTYRNQASSMDFQFESETPIWTKTQVLFPIVLVLSFFFHPGDKNKYYLTLQMCVSAFIFSESIGLIPQLYMIKNNKDVGNVNHYYGVILGLSRFFRLLFWLQMFFDGMSFYSLMIADLVHTIVLADFTYNVFKNKNNYTLDLFSNGAEDKSKKVF